MPIFTGDLKMKKLILLIALLFLVGCKPSVKIKVDKVETEHGTIEGVEGGIEVELTP